MKRDLIWLAIVVLVVAVAFAALEKRSSDVWKPDRLVASPVPVSPTPAATSTPTTTTNEHTLLKSYTFKNLPATQALTVIAADLHRDLEWSDPPHTTITLDLHDVRPISAWELAFHQLKPTIKAEWSAKTIKVYDNGGIGDGPNFVLPYPLKHRTLAEIKQRVAGAYPTVDQQLMPDKNMIVFRGSRRVLVDLKAYLDEVDR